MGLTKISWTDYTFNPWWGCSRVSSACRFCYADAFATRYGKDLWRRNGDRMVTSPANWRKPVQWNAAAEAKGTPAKTFCASMADVFEDHPDLREPRARLWDLIERTTSLRWQLLTKRPENIAGMVPDSWLRRWPTHVWPGATVESQRFAAARIEPLLSLGADTTFLSCEPLLGALDLTDIDGVNVLDPNDTGHENGLCWVSGPSISWIIIGGETGRKPRPMQLSWAESLVQQCHEHRVPVFVKQLGTVAGGKSHQDIATFSASLQVREYPVVTA